MSDLCFQPFILQQRQRRLEVLAVPMGDKAHAVAMRLPHILAHEHIVAGLLRIGAGGSLFEAESDARPVRREPGNEVLARTPAGHDLQKATVARLGRGEVDAVVAARTSRGQNLGEGGVHGGSGKEVYPFGVSA